MDIVQLLGSFGLLFLAIWRRGGKEGIFLYCMAGAALIAMGLSWRGTYDSGFGITLSIAMVGIGLYCLLLAIWNVISWISKR